MSQTYPFYQIDAFASKPFEGNQACVMPMGAFLDDETLQSIAAENNVAETAFIVPAGEGVWELRWFTPAVEAPLCGHATLAASHYLFTQGGFTGERIIFRTRQSGELYISQLPDGRIEMDFPAHAFRPAEIDEDVSMALGGRPRKAWAGAYYAALFETEEQIRALAPDMKALAELTSGGISERGNFGCFALGGPDGADVVSRYFAPGSGISEDPATGSWHCLLAPLIYELNGKKELKCFQAYPGRGAWIETALAGDRVKLRGHAVTVIEGVFHL